MLGFSFIKSGGGKQITGKMLRNIGIAGGAGYFGFFDKIKAKITGQITKVKMRVLDF